MASSPAFSLSFAYFIYHMMNVNSFSINPDWGYSGFYESVLVFWLNVLVVCLSWRRAGFNLSAVVGRQGGTEYGFFRKLLLPPSY